MNFTVMKGVTRSLRFLLHLACGVKAQHHFCRCFAAAGIAGYHPYVDLGCSLRCAAGEAAGAGVEREPRRKRLAIAHARLQHHRGLGVGVLEGMDDYISKPIKRAELAEKLGALVELPQTTGSSSGDTAQSALFDYETAISCMDGEIIEILTPAFLEHCPGEMSTLREAIARSDANAVQRVAHSLKGTFAAFGAEPALRRASEIESAAKAQHLLGMDALFDDLETQFSRLSAALRARLGVT